MARSTRCGFNGSLRSLWVQWLAPLAVGSMARSVHADTGRPEVTVGYSGTPLPKKLGIKPGMSMVVLNAPTNLDALLGELPERVAISSRLSGHHDLALIFVSRQVDFAARISALTTAIAPDGMIWVAWPKRASKIETDMTEDVIREIVLPSTGLVDVKVCAINHVWSGLKLVIRKKSR